MLNYTRDRSVGRLVGWSDGVTRVRVNESENKTMLSVTVVKYLLNTGNKLEHSADTVAVRVVLSAVRVIVAKNNETCTETNDGYVVVSGCYCCWCAIATAAACDITLYIYIYVRHTKTATFIQEDTVGGRMSPRV